MTFLGPKIEKLALNFGFLRPPWTRKNANFSFFGPKNNNNKKCWKYVFTYINLRTTMKFSFHHKLIKKKPQLYFYRVSFFQCGPKRWYLLVLTFLEHLSEILDFFKGWHSWYILKHPKILYVAYHILSQISITKTWRPI